MRIILEKEHSYGWPGEFSMRLPAHRLEKAGAALFIR